jgi:hypothetical protein
MPYAKSMYKAQRTTPLGSTVRIDREYCPADVPVHFRLSRHLPRLWYVRTIPTPLACCCQGQPGCCRWPTRPPGVLYADTLPVEKHFSSVSCSFKIPTSALIGDWDLLLQGGALYVYVVADDSTSTLYSLHTFRKPTSAC